ncbi:uncharacterized protein [Euphorbia lathyris]|uniref:uncharacterized protein n=1 Tax=Euphorbia lathyris TaxID=212925 RepID=UPI0033137D8D
MDDIASRGSDVEIDLENGNAISVDGNEISVENPSGDAVSGLKVQAKELFAKISSVFVDDSRRIEGVNSCHDSPNSNAGEENSVKKVVKEKRKKTNNNKKSPKPPRPPRGPSTLGPADQKLIKEITEIAMLKRARVERMKNLKKMKGAKASSSSNSNLFAMVFTVLFFLVILIQGMSSSRVTSVNVTGSLASAETPESGLIAVQYGGNPSTGDPNEPNFGSLNYVKSTAGFDSPVNLRTAAR